MSDFSQAESRMEAAINHFKQALQKIRTGRAHPGLVEHIQVDYYGSPTPLPQVCSITVEDARTLLLSPWEKTMIPAIERAIMQADLGLNPVSHSEQIRIPMPPLNEERRRDMIKLVKQEAESARVQVRNIRRDMLSGLKEELKEKLISEDDERRLQTQAQKITDQWIARVDDLLERKEAELMQI